MAYTTLKERFDEKTDYNVTKEVVIPSTKWQ